MAPITYARATRRVGGRGAFALRRHGPHRRDPDVGQADRLRDDATERGRGVGAAAGRTSARLSAAPKPALVNRPRLNSTAVRGQGLLPPAAPDLIEQAEDATPLGLAHQRVLR